MCPIGKKIAHLTKPDNKAKLGNQVESCKSPLWANAIKPALSEVPLVHMGRNCVLSLAMTSKRTKRFLYAFIASQPLVLFFLMLDQGLGIVSIPRWIIHLSLAIPWGAGVLATIYTLREIGLSVGREWVHWLLAIALVYVIQLYSAQEIHVHYIVPINLIVFPILALFLSHIDLRDTY